MRSRGGHGPITWLGRQVMANHLLRNKSVDVNEQWRKMSGSVGKKPGGFLNRVRPLILSWIGLGPVAMSGESSKRTKLPKSSLRLNSLGLSFLFGLNRNELSKISKLGSTSL